MGVDAEIVVKTTNPLSQDDVTLLAHKACDAFGCAKFWIQPEDRRHAINIIDVYEQDGPDILPAEGEQFLRLSLWSRYYGPGYERGDFAFLYALILWLQRNIPGGSVWYGGDSSGICAEEMTQDALGKLWAHFCEHGTAPYRSYFDRDKSGPTCDLCGVQMIRYGFGGAYAAWSCACGRNISERDGQRREWYGDYDDEEKAEVTA